MICESKGRNEPPNEAGASGYYQIVPSTWAAYGGGEPDDASAHSLGEQSAVAGRLYAADGTEPWVSSQTCWG